MDRNNCKEDTPLLHSIDTERDRPSYMKWTVLVLAGLLEIVNGIQNLQFAVFNRSVSKFFNVTTSVTDLLSDVYIVSFVVYAVPVLYFMRGQSVRILALYFAGLNFFGELLIVFSSLNGRLYSLAFIGQMVAGTSQVIALSFPVRLASAWFPENMTVLATSIVIESYMVGNALIFLFGGVMEPMSVSLSHNIQTVAIAVCIFSFVVIVLTYFLFPVASATAMEALKTYEEHTPYSVVLGSAVRDKNIVLLFISTSLIGGIYAEIQALTVEIVGPAFEDPASAQYVGTSMALAPVIFIPLFAAILDRTKAYRIMLVSTALCSFAFCSGMILSVYLQSVYLVFIMSTLLGISANGNWVLAFVVGAILMHPEPETTPSGLAYAGLSFFSVVAITVGRALFNYGEVANWMMMEIVLLIALLLSSFIEITGNCSRDPVRNNNEEDEEKSLASDRRSPPNAL